MREYATTLDRKRLAFRFALILVGALAGGCGTMSATPADKKVPAATTPPMASIERVKPAPIVLFDRAVVTKQHIECAIRIEAELDTTAGRLPAPGETWFSVRRGPSRVLVTAPHATVPGREGGQHVFADRGTGGLAALIHELTGATAVATTLASPSDPNYYDDNDFKRELTSLLTEIRPLMVLDLHGSHAFRPYDVDFGTMAGASIAGQKPAYEQLVRHLRQEGLLNFSQDFFAASKNATVTKFVAARGIPVMQLEISSTYLAPGADDLNAHRFAQVLQALVRFIRDVDSGDVALGERVLPGPVAPWPAGRVCGEGVQR